MISLIADLVNTVSNVLIYEFDEDHWCQSSFPLSSSILFPLYMIYDLLGRIPDKKHMILGPRCVKKINHLTPIGRIIWLLTQIWFDLIWFGRKNQQQFNRFSFVLLILHKCDCVDVKMGCGDFIILRKDRA